MCSIVEDAFRYLADRPQVHSDLSELPFQVIISCETSSSEYFVLSRRFEFRITRVFVKYIHGYFDLIFAACTESWYAPSWLLQLFEGDQCRVPRQDRVVLLASFSNQSASSHHCSTVSVIWDSDNVEEEFSFIITPFWLRYFMIRLKWCEQFERFYHSELSVSNSCNVIYDTIWKIRTIKNDFINAKYHVSVSNSCNILKIMSGLLSLPGTDYGSLGGIY